ncbi:MAG: four helix bundle protein [Pyrinomonadaceae bacterium]|nr:four helix bundle protein [Pyrinomonadaceae bacterium]
MEENDVLREKAFSFALRIVDLSRFFVSNYRELVLSKQVLRSGTSIGANLAEARQAQSRSDFVHKLSISNKEASETNYWIELLEASHFITTPQARSLLGDCTKLQRLLIGSINTVKRKSGYKLSIGELSISRLFHDKELQYTY